MARAGRNEDGGTLVLALVFVTVVSLLIGGTLAFAQVSVRLGDTLAEGRGTLYAVDGAMEAAIAKLEAAGACGNSPIELNGIEPSVSCISGIGGGFGSAGSEEAFSQALLAVGNAEGITQAPGSDPVTIGGSVFSNAAVAAVLGAASGLKVQGRLGAVGSCNAGVSAAPLECDLGPGKTLATPMAASEIESLPTYKEVPPCPATGPAVLEAGYYDNAAGLSLLTSDACGATVVWFKPGDYFFNFDYQSGTPCSPASDCIWTIDDDSVKVVAGSSLAPSAGATVPGVCASGDPGVQFVFGGQSQMEVLDGDFELCARKASPEDISIFGLATPVMPPTIEPFTDREPDPLQGSVMGFETLARAVDIDGLFADADLTAATPTASVTLEAYDIAPLPPGAKITSASLKVKHKQSVVGVVDARATVVGSPDVVLNGCPVAMVACEETPGISLSASQLNGGFDITYEATLSSGPGVTASLDGIYLSYAYQAPYLEPLSGCHGPPPPAYPGATRCALFKARNTPAIGIGGLLYSPGAVLDLELTDIARPVLSGGAIVRTARLGLTDATESTPPIIAQDYRPGLVALGPSMDDGILVADHPFLVEGDVSSRSKISTIDGGRLHVRGGVRAATCDSAQIVSSSLADCNTDNANVNIDPKFSVPTSSPPVVNPPCGAGLVTVEPGWHNDIARLNDLTNDGGSCDPEVVWFKPGNHYFNFDFSGAANCEAGLGPACVWKVDNPDVRVVGGAASAAWNPAAFDATKVTFPGGCRQNLSGARFIFGGPSRLEVLAGSVEVCAGPVEEPVALHGLSRSSTLEAVVTATATASAEILPFEEAKIIDNDPAQVTLMAPSASGTLTLSGFGALPSGVRIEAVEARVRHREDAGVGIPALTASSGVVEGSITACALVYCTNTVSVAGVNDGMDLANLSLTYTVTGSGEAQLDGIELDVTYVEPGFQRLSGCLVRPTGDPNACSLVTTSPPAKLAVQGITYAPTAGIDIELDGVTSAVFADSVITRTMALSVETPICTNPEPCFAAARGASGGSSNLFDLVVSVRPKEGEDPRRRLRARVKLDENGKPEIKSWKVIP